MINHQYVKFVVKVIICLIKNAFKIVKMVIMLIFKPKNVHNAFQIAKFALIIMNVQSVIIIMIMVYKIIFYTIHYVLHNVLIILIKLI